MQISENCLSYQQSSAKVTFDIYPRIFTISISRIHLTILRITVYLINFQIDDPRIDQCVAFALAWIERTTLGRETKALVEVSQGFDWKFHPDQDC